MSLELMREKALDRQTDDRQIDGQMIYGGQLSRLI